MLDIISSDLPLALATPMGQIQNGFRRLTALVEGMSQAALDYRGPTGDLNSTAMLIRHLAQVDLDYLHTIMGAEKSPELEELYGPYHDEHGRIPLVSGQSARELLAHYHQVIELVESYLRAQSSEEASREVTVPWWPQTATVRYILWHMASHSSFHQGQISRLKAWYDQLPAQLSDQPEE